MLHHTRVSDVMTSAVVFVRPEDGIAEVARTLNAAAVRAVPVLTEGGALLGVVSETDLMAAAARPAGSGPTPWWRPLNIHFGHIHFGHIRLRHIQRGHHDRDAGATTAEQLMTPSVETLRPWARVAEAARRMCAASISWMPVTELDGRLVGVLTSSDVLKVVFRRDDEEIRAAIRHDVLHRALAVDPDTVRVEVADGVVTLIGELGTPADVEIARHLVDGMDGVVAVVDRLHPRVGDQQRPPVRLFF
jgi:CBS-domain-containing membrane protein